MDKILKKIDTTLFEAEEISVEELAKQYRLDLNNSNILRTESATYQSDATFDSKIWIFYNENTSKYHIINFSEIEDMVKLGVINKDDYIILKCWIVDEITSNNILPSSKAHKMYHFLNIFIETHGFTKKFIQDNTGNKIKTFIDYLESDGVKRDVVNHLKSYINFIERIGYLNDGYPIFLKTVFEYEVKTKRDKPRKLPKNSHVFEFDYYIKDFFEGDNDPLLQKIYYPIWIWWKVTNVIPMRPSELTTKTTRDCLITIDDKYYLKVNRVKVERTRHTINKPMIPVLDKLEITKEIYDLIQKYIDFTDSYESYTLFSWTALIDFKEKYMDLRYMDDYKEYLPFFHIDYEQKFNPLVFSRDNLKMLLSSFYTYIIENLYGCHVNDEDKLTLGDTRHLAFCSLYLQGMSPVEIAMIGGHTTLEMQDSYTNHVTYYIDDEILSFISDKSICGTNAKMFNTLKDIVDKKPWSYELNVDLSDFEKTDDGVGYCLLDTDTNEFCDDVPYCAFCSKWWCEPTNHSYKVVRDYILDNEINPLQRELEVEEQFFIKLINQAKVLNINGLAELDKSDENAIKSQSLKIRAKADKIAFLKASLLERDFEKNTTVEKMEV